MDTHSVGEHYRQELGSKSFTRQSEVGAVDSYLNRRKLNLSNILVESGLQPLRVRSCLATGNKATADQDHR
jgi:hypothetical protein